MSVSLPSKFQVSCSHYYMLQEGTVNQSLQAKSANCLLLYNPYVKGGFLSSHGWGAGGRIKRITLYKLKNI